MAAYRSQHLGSSQHRTSMGHEHQLLRRPLIQFLWHREQTTGKGNSFKRSLVASAFRTAQDCGNAVAKLNARCTRWRVLGEWIHIEDSVCYEFLICWRLPKYLYRTPRWELPNLG